MHYGNRALLVIRMSGARLMPGKFKQIRFSSGRQACARAESVVICETRGKKMS